MSEKAWNTYEEVAAHLLNKNAEEFGLNQVEGKQAISGRRSGTSWEIDAKGIKKNGAGFIIIECRRYTTSKQNQEKMGALAYRIIDTGSAGGIIVSPMGLQSGAEKVASAEGILEVVLDADSTPSSFAMQFLNKLMIGIHDKTSIGDKLDMPCFRVCRQCGEKFELKKNTMICPQCEIDEHT